MNQLSQHRLHLLFIMILLVIATGGSAVYGLQPAGTVASDAVVDDDAELRCQRAQTWQSGQSQMLLLENNVTVGVGAYGFRADRAVIRIDEEEYAGRKVRRLMMYLLNARALPGRGATTAEAARLLVTGTTTGKVDLLADLLTEGAPADDELVEDAAARTATYLAAISGQSPAAAGPAMSVRMTRRPPTAPLGPISPDDLLPGVPDAQPVAGGGAGAPRMARTVGRGGVLPTDGVVSFRAEKVVLRANDKPKSVVLIGAVRVVYHGSESRAGMSLSADNGVIFLADDGATEFGGDRLSAGSVQGVYLEDNVVATDGDYTVRSPRVFYDLKTNRAVLLDAVMYTWDVNRKIPLYVRAEKLMQHSRTTWGAAEAVVTTSEFAEPHFSIGARQVTVMQKPGDEGPEYHFRARKNVARVGKMPVFFWPEASGKIQDIPLRRFDVAYSSNDGVSVRTSWDAFALLGMDKPNDTDLFAHIDYLGERGPAVGVNLEYGNKKTGDKYGHLDGYLLFADHGEDQLSNRMDVDGDGQERGYAHWQHRQYLDNNWELSFEAAHVSDVTFLEEFFHSEAQELKPYETSMYLVKREDDWAATFLAKYNLDSFVAQTTALQAPGFVVDKMPEVGYHRIGTSLWNDRLTWYSQNHVSHLRVRAGDDEPGDRGFTAMQSMLLFGVGPTTQFDAALRAAGVETDYITRFDSRQELQMPMRVSIFDVVPFIAGRVTAWSDETLNTPGKDSDGVRLWGSGGVRIHTEFSKTYDHVSSKVFDLHRLRHIIEPTIEVSYSSSSVARDDLFVIENDVEGINQGLMTRFALRNTWQTQRGGPGRWRTVDWLTVDTDLVLMNEEEGHKDQVPHYFGYRPENSRGDDHFYTRVLWMISDTLGMVAEVTEDLEENETSQWRIGATLQHTPALALYVDYVSIHEYNNKDINWGFEYQLTSKYRVLFNHRTNLERTDDRSMELSLVRQLPRWKLVVLAELDELDDEQIFGIVLIPDGLGGSRYSRPTFRSPHFD